MKCCDSNETGENILSICKTLLEIIDDPNQTDIEEVQMPNLPSKRNGNTALIISTETGRIDCAKEIIKKLYYGKDYTKVKVLNILIKFINTSIRLSTL